MKLRPSCTPTVDQSNLHTYGNVYTVGIIVINKTLFLLLKITKRNFILIQKHIKKASRLTENLKRKHIKKSNLSHNPKIFNGASPVSQPPVRVGNNHGQQSYTHSQATFRIRTQQGERRDGMSVRSNTKT
jgi:hypothetical protein